jgi:hypothetical protein
MKFIKAVEINRANLNTLQPGQWVYSVDMDSMGRFLGVKRNGIVVVSWSRKLAIVKALRQYAKV